MSGPEDDPLLEFAPDEPPDGFFQQSGDTRAVPPPVHNEIDGLVDAISAGGRPRVPGESAVIAEADDSSSADAIVTAFALQPSRPSVVHSAAFRYAACAVVAFAVGMAIAWSLLHRFEGSSSVAVNPSATIEAPRRAPIGAPPAPAVAPTQPAPVSSAAAIERKPAADAPITASPITAPPNTAAPIAVAPKRVPVIATPLPNTAAAVPPRLDDAPRAGIDLAAVASSVPSTVIAPPPAALPASASSALSAIAVEQSAVLETLREYARAYEALDVKATAAVWPSVDRRALTRAFSTLKSHQLELEDCRVTIADSSATPHCRGMVEYVRKIGSSAPRTGYQDLVFKMRKLGDEWFIDEVSASELTARR